MADLDIVTLLLNSLKKSVKQAPVAVDGLDEDGFPAMTEARRDKYQFMMLGTMAVLMVDRVCRSTVVQLEKDLGTFFNFCDDLPGYGA